MKQKNLEIPTLKEVKDINKKIINLINKKVLFVFTQFLLHKVYKLGIKRDLITKT